MYVGNFTNQATLMRQKYQERATQTADAAKAAMQKASRHLWKCDPKFHVRGKCHKSTVYYTRVLFMNVYMY